jgi:hypothetical protein
LSVSFVNIATVHAGRSRLLLATHSRYSNWDTTVARLLLPISAIGKKMAGTSLIPAKPPVVAPAHHHLAAGEGQGRPTMKGLGPQPYRSQPTLKLRRQASKVRHLSEDDLSVEELALLFTAMRGR